MEPEVRERVTLVLAGGTLAGFGDPVRPVLRVLCFVRWYREVQQLFFSRLGLPVSRRRKTANKTYIEENVPKLTEAGKKSAHPACRVKGV